jgi:hypothetical protein
VTFIIKATALFFSIGLSACANVPTTEAAQSWAQGWRQGTVTAVADRLSADLLAGPCQSELLQRPPGLRWVTVQYRSNSRPVWRTVAVPAASNLRVNDRVAHNPKDCSAPVVAQAS